MNDTEEIITNGLESNNKDSAFQVLTESDQRLLEEATRNIIPEIKRLYPGDLPDAVIYPDTSGRVLSELMKPVFKKIAKDRGSDVIPIPVFFKVSTKDYGSFEFDYPYDLFDGDLTPEEMLKKVGRESQELRAEEINEHFKSLNRKPEIIIIDEYASDEHSTINSIRNAFKDAEMQAFPLMSRQDFRDSEDSIVLGHIFQGIVDPKILAGEWSSYGFDYHKQQQDAIEEPDKSHSLIGVSKVGQEDSLYVTKSTNTSHEEMKSLRHDMRMIGEKIAKDIN